MDVISIVSEWLLLLWDDNDVSFVLDQNELLAVFSASTLKQWSVVRNVAPLGHNVVLNSSNSIFAHTP